SFVQPATSNESGSDRVIRAAAPYAFRDAIHVCWNFDVSTRDVAATYVPRTGPWRTWIETASEWMSAFHDRVQRVMPFYRAIHSASAEPPSRATSSPPAAETTGREPSSLDALTSSARAAPPVGTSATSPA